MGPLYHPKQIQDPIQFRTSQEMGSGKGTETGNSQLLFPAISSTKKEWKVTRSNRASLLNQYINKQHFKMETVNNGQRLGCLHRSDGCISSCTDTSVILKIPSVRLRTSGLSVHGLTLWNVPKSVDFHKNNGCNSSALTATCHISLPILRRLADKRFDSQSTDLSNKILSSNSTKSRIHTKSKEVRFDTTQKFTFIDSRDTVCLSNRKIFIIWTQMLWSKKWWGGQENSAFDALRRLTASKAYSTYIKVINILYIYVGMGSFLGFISRMILFQEFPEP